MNIYSHVHDLFNTRNNLFLCILLHACTSTFKVLIQYLLFIGFREIPLLHDPLVWSESTVSGGYPLLHLIQGTGEVGEPVHHLITRSAGR